MFEFSQTTKPFISEETCGDFGFYLECKNSYLVCVGDIGGHGNAHIHELALKIESIITEHKEENIYAIFELIKKQEHVSQYGLVLLLGRINKSLPTFQYISIGNLKLHRVRNKIAKRLNQQNGVIGLELPINIEQNIVKLQSNDYIVISSDGVNNYESEVSAIIQNSSSIKEASQSIIDTFALKIDDAISCVIKYIDPNHTSQHITYNIKPKPPSTTTLQKQKKVVAFKAEPKKVKVLITNKDTKTFVHHFEAMQKQYLFASIADTTMARKKLSDIVNYFTFDRSIKIKLQTVVLEILKKNTDYLNIFTDGESLQVQTSLTKESFKRISSLFVNNELSYDSKNSTLIIQLPLVQKIDIHSESFTDKKEMLKFGLDKDDYTSFKDEKSQNMSLLTQQSRLAQMGEMINMIAHQWRQPLSAIAATGLNVKTKTELDFFDFSKEEEAQNYAAFVDESFNDINEYVQILTKTIDDFRNFYKTSNHLVSTTITSILSKAVNIVEKMYKSENISIVVNHEKGDFNLSLNERELIQVLLNFLSNARDAFHENKVVKPTIFITTSHGDNKVSISVEDNAGGVPDDIIDQIFQPYFSTKDKNGTGIGLHMVYIIIKEHIRGEVSVNNTDKGAKFTITFPLLLQ